MSQKKRVRKVIAKKVTKVAPDTHEIVMEVVGAPDPPVPLPLVEPLVLDLTDYDADAAAPAVERKPRGFWAWLFGTENDG
jgi:hypothetical protein